ncbi:hypothetical protein UlMin_044609 [Ulmus minor]
MASSKQILLPFLGLWVYVGLFQETTSVTLSSSGGGGDSVASMPCMKRLLPCQNYLKSPETPPLTCCLPLTEMVSENPKCLCDIFNNPQLLKNLNVTKDDSLKLPKACGVHPDISLCKNYAITPTATPSIPSNPTPSSGTSSFSSNSASTSTNRATKGIYLITGSGFVIGFLGLFVSAL